MAKTIIILSLIITNFFSFACGEKHGLRKAEKEHEDLRARIDQLAKDLKKGRRR